MQRVRRGVRVLWTLLVAAGAVTALACGTGSLNLSSLGGEACNGGVPNPLVLGSTPSCKSCVTTTCAKAQSCMSTACAAYDKCYCACAVGDLSCVGACQPDLTGECSACQNGVSSCIETSCASHCADAGVGGGGGDGAAPTGICATLAKCCKNESGFGQQLCNSAANGNNEGICQATYNGLHDAGVCH